ncbi:hypothetical protein J6590_069531 [Homalodisca vitripennis]|nr:hypothetical protein J6590_069531 [Homalodisca vitripennis]
MMSPHEKDQTRAKLLLRAIDKHNELMAKARNNEGCDRHLFGLYCIAVENNLPVPQLYLDPLYKKSGGGGNFILSTSLLGYSPTAGGVSPMCLNGYGVFYSISPESLMFTISVRRDSPETSSNKLFQSLHHSLLDMVSLLEAHMSSKL